MANKNFHANTILPFRAIIVDFLNNLWHLRLFLIIIFVIVCTSSAIFYTSENNYILPNEPIKEKLKEMLFIIVSDVAPGKISNYSAKTDLGKCVTVINSFCGFVLLGLLIWVIQQSMSGHNIKKSKFLIIPTKEDV